MDLLYTRQAPLVSAISAFESAVEFLAEKVRFEIAGLGLFLPDFDTDNGMDDITARLLHVCDELLSALFSS
eukprot:12932470-Prorocentrum_lima.AAC.1